VVMVDQVVVMVTLPRKPPQVKEPRVRDTMVD